MGLTVEDTVALLDDGEADGLGKVAFASSGRSQEEGILVLVDEAGGGELEDELAVHLPVEVEVEGVERPTDVAKGRVLEATGEQTILSSHELVTDEGGEEVERDLLFGLRLEQPRLEDVGHAGEPQLA